MGQLRRVNGGGGMRMRTTGMGIGVPGKRGGSKKSPRKKQPQVVYDDIPWFIRNWSVVLMLGTMLLTLATFLHSAGWLTAPAKESQIHRINEDLTSIKSSVTAADAASKERDSRIEATIRSVSEDAKDQRSAISRVSEAVARVEGKLDAAGPGNTVNNRPIGGGRAASNNHAR